MSRDSRRLSSNLNLGRLKFRSTSFQATRVSDSIAICEITKSFGSNRVLHEVSLSVRAGEFVSLVGPSGCGKSTLLRIIAGLSRQDSGSITLGGRAVDELSPHQRRVAMVFQNFALYPHMTVRENVATPLRMSRLGPIERQPWLGALIPGRTARLVAIEREVRALCDTLGLGSLLDRKPGQLSGGQRQRVALARAMVREPSVFLMDEPLSNLDAKLRLQVRDDIAELHRRLGATFVYVTHDQIEAMTLSDRVAVMDAGRILQLGTPAELYANPSCLAVARFIGSPPISVLTLAFDGRGRTDLAGHPLVLHGLESRSAGPLSIGIRPEHLKIATTVGGDQSSDRVSLPARVCRAENHGADWVLALEAEAVEPGLLLCRVPSDALPSGIGVGAWVTASFRPSDALVFEPRGRRLVAQMHRLGSAACVRSGAG